MKNENIIASHEIGRWESHLSDEQLHVKDEDSSIDYYIALISDQLTTRLEPTVRKKREK